MSLPEGTHLAYVVNHEAWYASTVLADEPPTVMVQASAEGEGGGVAWEFPVEDGSHLIGRPGLRLKMWGDSWEAFAQVPEFFAVLAGGEVATLDDLRGLLDSLGAVDETARVSPYESEAGR